MSHRSSRIKGFFTVSGFFVVEVFVISGVLVRKKGDPLNFNLSVNLFHVRNNCFPKNTKKHELKKFPFWKNLEAQREHS